jgi:integrase
MKKLKHKPAVVSLNNTSVVIYYSLGNDKLRFPTGIKISSEKNTLGKFTCWDYTNNKLKLAGGNNNKNSLNILKTQQKVIDDLLNYANEIINEFFLNNNFVYPQYLELRLKDYVDGKVKKSSTGFFEYFDEFEQRKKEHFQIRGSLASYKDYVSTRLLLIDYRHYINREIRITDFTTHWLEDFVNYMTIEHNKFYGEHKVSSVGRMKNSTIKKRLNIISEFFTYLKETKVVNSDMVDVIKNFKRTIKKEVTYKETLDINEIHQLYKFDFKEPHHKTMGDLFVFLCLTGVRYQDLDQFDKRFIMKSKDGDGFIYKKSASKTGIDYNIPLCKIVIEILEKYKYSLPKITDQYGNRMIKEALKMTGMFEDFTQIKDKDTGEYKRRYDTITLHKGRNSFITNLVDVTPLNELMKYTGHKKLSTLQGYIDTKRPVKMNYIKVFDIKE